MRRRGTDSKKPKASLKKINANGDSSIDPAGKTEKFNENVEFKLKEADREKHEKFENHEIENEIIGKKKRKNAVFFRPKYCLSILKWLFIIIIIPPIMNYGALKREAASMNMPGQLYDIGLKQKLYMHCIGKGIPTVILDAPTGMSSDVWDMVQQEISKVTKVCVYDRAGIGLSDRPYQNQTIVVSEQNKNITFDEYRQRWDLYTVERMVDDLHRLITISSQQLKPFVLVGSELGGMVAQFYTQTFEGDVSDVLLIDPLSEDIFNKDATIWTQYWFGQLVPSFQAIQLAAATGVMRLALIVGLANQPIVGENISEEIMQRQKYFLCNPRHLSSIVDEHFFINKTVSQMRTLRMMRPFPSNVSITILNGNYYDEQLPSNLNKAWAKSQQMLISKIPHAKHLVVNGVDHHMIYRSPKSVSEPIIRIVKKRRLMAKNKKQ